MPGRYIRASGALEADSGGAEYTAHLWFGSAFPSEICQFVGFAVVGRPASSGCRAERRRFTRSFRPTAGSSTTCGRRPGYSLSRQFARRLLGSHHFLPGSNCCRSDDGLDVFHL